MKMKLYAKLIIVGISVFLSKNIVAQSPVIITDSIAVIDFTKYFVHKVQKQQTLYSISKAYKTSVEQIIELNPGTKNGLLVNTFLIIPFTPDLKVSEEKYVKHTVRNGETLASIASHYDISVDTIIRYNPEAKNKLSVNQLLLFPASTIIEFDPDFIYHKVKPKETLFGLSQQYDVKLKIIEKYNEHIENKELQIGEYIKIPKSKVDYIDKIPNRQEENYVYHKVERKQTLYSISKLYNVDISKIVEENEDLQRRGLISGEILRIPLKVVDKEIIKDTIPVDSIALDSIMPIEIQDYNCVKLEIKSERSLNIALMLPFYTSINNSMNTVNEFNNSEKSRKEDDNEYKIYGRSKMFIDFYQGCLIALEDLNI